MNRYEGEAILNALRKGEEINYVGGFRNRQ
jgi:hypothetical protein